MYYGDASRLELLQAAHADRAVAFVLAIDDVEASVRTAELVRRHFPNLKIYARARNRSHAYRLMELGIDVVWRETFLTALDMARELLTNLGLSAYAAERSVQLFREHDERRLYGLFGEHRNEAQDAGAGQESGAGAGRSVCPGCRQRTARPVSRPEGRLSSSACCSR